MENNRLKEYLEKLRNGDTEAFAEIYSSLKVPVLTIVYLIVSSLEEAEDITQDLFLKLFLSPPDPSVANPRAWIFQTAHNFAIDALRKRRCSEPEDDVPSSGAAEYDNIALRLDLEMALSQLNQTQREVVVLYTTGELTYNEISKIMGMSLPAVYRCYRGAIKKLQNMLNGGIE